MATTLTATIGSDKPEPATDLEGLLANWASMESQVYVRLSRYTEDNKIPTVGTLRFDSTTEDVKKAWGGGKYRAQVTAREAFTMGDKTYPRGKICDQLVFDIEGDPIRRLASNITAALREADQAPGTRPPLMAGPSPAAYTPPSQPMQPMDPMGMVTISLQMMMQSQQIMAERAAAQQRETQDLFMAMLANQRTDHDPLEQLDRILGISKKLNPQAADPTEAILAALPAIGRMAEGLLARVGENTAARRAAAKQPPQLAQSTPAEPQGGQQTEAQAGHEFSREHRTTMAMQVLVMCVQDPECAPDSAADVIATMVGPEIARVMAGDPTTVEQVLEFAPYLADHKDQLEAIHAGLAAMFEGDEDSDAAGDDGQSDDVPAPAETSSPRQAG